MTNATQALLRVEITEEENDIGYPAYFATPYYRVNDRVVSIPSDRGFPTRGEAEVEAARIRAEAGQRGQP